MGIVLVAVLCFDEEDAEFALDDEREFAFTMDGKLFISWVDLGTFIVWSKGQ